jgi:hypothetical protein
MTTPPTPQQPIENLRPREAAEKTAEHTRHGGHAYTRIRRACNTPNASKHSIVARTSASAV